jgi:hypothetical protein
VGAASATTITLNPAATYLRVNNDPAPAAMPIALEPLGIAGGDRILLTRLGDWDNGPGGEEFNTLTGVFSSSAVILPGDQLKRIPGAIAAGVATNSPPTFFGGLPTNIDEDFLIASPANPSGQICITVPKGATHLFFSVGDVLFFDNLDNDGDWKVRIELDPSCVGDLDGDGQIGPADLGILLGAWGTTGAIGRPGDLDCDGKVGASDLATLLGAWGSC